MAAKTLYDKIWNAHLVRELDGGAALIYIDRHLLHEVTSPQAFEGLRLTGRKPWRKDAGIAVPDHSVPTGVEERQAGTAGFADDDSRIQVQTLSDNCQEFAIHEIPIDSDQQGIVHIVGPELGISLPGMTIVCGDSHTSTHGALGAIAFGIGTSEVEHVLATQCLVQHRMENMRVSLTGQPGAGIFAKDLVLAIIGRIGVAGGAGTALEFSGETVRALSMEGRMTLCNMATEAGARIGLVAVDDTTLAYVKERPAAPSGQAWEEAEAAWRELYSDEDAVFERQVSIDVSDLAPQVTWGTSPEMVVPVNGSVPNPADEPDEIRRRGMERGLEYMALKPGTAISDIPLDRVFIGSCTNSRIEDLRAAAAVLKGRRLADNIRQAIVVPGSGQVRAQAERENLHEVFQAAGAEWREPGCSMCIAMNADRLEPGERCASTSNRNFEGRQGHGGRTHLVSPAMAAAAMVAGHFADVREML